MSKKPLMSSSNDKHPYLVTRKWADGTLAFWRKKPQSYSPSAIEYYENTLKEWKDRENNMAALNDTPL